LRGTLTALALELERTGGGAHALVPPPFGWAALSVRHGNSPLVEGLQCWLSISVTQRPTPRTVEIPVQRIGRASRTLCVMLWSTATATSSAHGISPLVRCQGLHHWVRLSWVSDRCGWPKLGWKRAGPGDFPERKRCTSLLITSTRVTDLYGLWGWRRQLSRNGADLRCGVQQTVIFRDFDALD